MYILSQARFALRSRSFQYKATAASGIVFRLSQAGEQSSQEIRRLFTDRMRTQAMTEPRGEGLSTPSLQSPKSFPDGPFVPVPVLGCPSLEESYLSFANQSSAQGQAG